MVSNYDSSPHKSESNDSASGGLPPSKSKTTRNKAVFLKKYTPVS